MNKYHSVRDISIKFALRSMLAAGSLAVFAAGARTAQAQVFANFTGGNDTTAGGTATPGPDTYKGTAGNGFSGGYVINGNNNGGALLTAAVTNTSPLSGGGNYLAVTDAAADNSDAALTRAYNGVSATSNQTISLDYRLDTALSAGYVTIGDGAPGAAGVSAASSFIIRDYAVTNGGATANQWAIYNGGRNGGGFNTANFVSSGLTVTSGDVYHFTINLNPTTLTYTVTIADTTAGTSFTSGGEGFRTANTTLQNVVTFNDSDGGSALGYSIDSISIVPEPSTWVAGLVGIGMVGVIARRRRIA